MLSKVGWVFEVNASILCVVVVRAGRIYWICADITANVLLRFPLLRLIIPLEFLSARQRGELSEGPPRVSPSII